MPLLRPEPFLFPDDLLQQPQPPADSDGRWWVLHTRPRAEKSLARRAREVGLPFFLPLHHHRWRSRGRLFSSYLPLFNGYLFVFGDYFARLQALQTNLVARTLSVVDQQQFHEDLRRVYHMMTAGVPLTPEERLQPGDPVEVISGPLAGLEGKVIRRGKQLKFFIEVQLLQRGVSVEIESWMIRALASRPAASHSSE